jgi:hypothetical protein
MRTRRWGEGPDDGNGGAAAGAMGGYRIDGLFRIEVACASESDVPHSPLWQFFQLIFSYSPSLTFMGKTLGSPIAYNIFVLFGLVYSLFFWFYQCYDNKMIQLRVQ